MSQQALQKLRAQYPEYSDLSDQDLASKVIKAYPEYQDLLGDVTQARKPTFTMAHRPGSPTVGQYAQSALEELSVPVGALLGGAAGAAMGGVPAVGGAALGGAMGSQLPEFTRPFLAPGTGTPRTPLEALKAGGMGAVQGGTMELGGQLVGRGLQTLAAPFARPAGRMAEARQLAQEAVPSLQFTAAQATENRAIDILENVAEASLIGGGSLAKFKGKQQEVIAQAATGLAERFGARASNEEVGTMFQAGLAKGQDAFRAAAKTLYQQVDAQTASAMVPMHQLKAEALKVQGQWANLPPKLGSDVGLGLIQQITDMPNSVPFAQAQLIRSQLLKRGRELSDIEGGLSRRFAGLVDDAMEGAAGTLKGPALESWRIANAFYKEGAARFNSDFVQALADKAPEKVAGAIFQRGGVTALRQARAAVSAETFQKVQGAFLWKVLGDSTDPVTGVIGAKAFQNALFGRSGIGTEALDVGMGNAVRRELQGLSEALRISQSASSTGTGKIFIQLKQAGASVQVLTAVGTGFATGGLGTPAAIILGPAALGKMLANPQAIKWLSTGIKLGPGSAQGTRALAQLAGWAMSQGPQSQPSEEE